MTAREEVFHELNLLWGIKPVLVNCQSETFEQLVALAEARLRELGLASAGDRVLVLGGVPARQPRGTNFVKIHTLH